jgi:hypothetical protein
MRHRLIGPVQTQMNVAIDQSWEQRQLTKIDKFDARRWIGSRLDADDPPMVHEDLWPGNVMALNTVEQPACTKHDHRQSQEFEAMTFIGPRTTEVDDHYSPEAAAQRELDLHPQPAMSEKENS